MGENFEIQVVSGTHIRGSFWALNLRWRVQNLVSPSPADMMNQAGEPIESSKNAHIQLMKVLKNDKVQGGKSIL